jgi:hypothetical protein
MHVHRNVQESYVMARVMRQRHLYQRNFTLKEHGSWEKAEAAAKRWIKAFVPTLPPKVPREGRLTKRNRSGAVGVYRSPGIRAKPNGKVYYCPRWVARWLGCPLRGGLSWSVKQFDEEGAFVLAYLGLKKKSINRTELLADFDSIFGTEEYENICALKKM